MNQTLKKPVSIQKVILRLLLYFVVLDVCIMQHHRREHLGDDDEAQKGGLPLELHAGQGIGGGDAWPPPASSPP